jgi:tetratricopeptide (TPR) repeat protein
MMRYRSGVKTIEEVGRELDVRYVVESSLRRANYGLRISTSVVPVDDQTGRTWWSELFDPDSTAAETQQTYAAIRIAHRIATGLATPADDSSPLGTTIDGEAWNSVMRAVAHINSATPDDVGRAVAQLEHAVQRDPAFGAAWAKLAEAKHLLVMMGTTAPADAYPDAQRAAENALKAAPDLAAAHLARGLVQLWYEWRPQEAAASFERALQLNPSLAAAHHDYAWSLVALGRADDAIRHITRSRDLDPVSTRANNDVGWLYLHLRRPEDAARACERTHAIDAGSLEAQACLERSYTDRQLFGAALQAARATLGGYDGAPASAGDRPHDDLRAIWNWRLQQLERAAQKRWVNPYTLAVHYALTGDKTRALDALDDAVAKRVGMMVFAAHDSALDSLRGHPRFESLLTKVTGRSF